jgi:hypothetical protein
MKASTIICEMNRKALALLRDGDFERSVLVLDEALGYLRYQVYGRESLSYSEPRRSQAAQTHTVVEADCHMQIEAGQASSIEEAASCSKGIMDEPSQCMIQSAPITPNAPAHLSFDQHQNIFEFYPRVFHFNIKPEMQESESTCMAQLVVLLYNMAVAFHSEAISYQNRNAHDASVHFRRALDLYNTAQSVLHGAWYDIEDEDMLLLLALGLSNNCGHIHSYFLDHKEVRHSLDAVRHFMLSIPEFEGSGLTKDDYMFFFQTTIIYQGHDFTAAPCA